MKNEIPAGNNSSGAASGLPSLSAKVSRSRSARASGTARTSTEPCERSTGPPGARPSSEAFLARARYWRASRLYPALARADGTYGRFLGQLARVDVLVLDDWALSPLQDAERRDILEILEDRSGTRSTVVTSQLPPKRWHDYVADPTLADAICDRLLHNAHRIVLQGPSRRKEEKLDS